MVLKDMKIRNPSVFLHWAGAFVLWWQLFVIQTNVLFSCVIFTRQDQWLRMGCRSSQLPSLSVGQELFTVLVWLPAQPRLSQSRILLVLDEWSSKLCDILCFAQLLICRVFSVSIKFIIIVALPN